MAAKVKAKKAVAIAPDEQKRSEQEAAANAAFPYPVESPYIAGWEHVLTKKYGLRGKTWTSTKAEPQWTVRFKDSEAAAWFKSTQTAEASKA